MDHGADRHLAEKAARDRAAAAYHERPYSTAFRCQGHTRYPGVSTCPARDSNASPAFFRIDEPTA